MTLTLEQQRTLEKLLAQMPRAEQPNVIGKVESTAEPIQGLEPDLLQGFTGISSHDLKKQLLTWLGKKDALEQWLVETVDRNPLEASTQFLGLASVAFYVAEKDENPKVKTMVDAFYFISTCASVGYADIFPVTQTGRMISSLVMTVGPALTAKALDGRKS
jgi:Ion channel